MADMIKKRSRKSKIELRQCEDEVQESPTPPANSPRQFDICVEIESCDEEDEDSYNIPDVKTEAEIDLFEAEENEINKLALSLCRKSTELREQHKISVKKEINDETNDVNSENANGNKRKRVPNIKKEYDYSIDDNVDDDSLLETDAKKQKKTVIKATKNDADLTVNKKVDLWKLLDVTAEGFSDNTFTDNDVKLNDTPHSSKDFSIRSVDEVNNILEKTKKAVEAGDLEDSSCDTNLIIDDSPYFSSQFTHKAKSKNIIGKTNSENSFNTNLDPATPDSSNDLTQSVDKINVKKKSSKKRTKGNSTPNNKPPQILKSLNISEDVILQHLDELCKKTEEEVDKILEVEMRNQWGRIRSIVHVPTEREKNLNDILKALRVRVSWKTFRDLGLPLTYKCYACKKAWWHLDPFRDHINEHKEPDLQLKIESNTPENHIAAFIKDVSPRFIPIEDDCWRCGKNYEYHVADLNKKRPCSYCSSSFTKCEQWKEHEKDCIKRALKLSQVTDVAELRERLALSCSVCGLKIFDLELQENPNILEEHMKFYHTVRSDLLTIKFNRECSACAQPMQLTQYHQCPKRILHFECMYCNKRFLSRADHDLHLKWSEDSFDFHCRICGDLLEKKCLEVEHLTRHSTNFTLVHKCVQCAENVLLLDAYSMNQHWIIWHKTVNSKKKYFETVLVPKTILEKEEVKNLDILPTFVNVKYAAEDGGSIKFLSMDLCKNLRKILKNADVKDMTPTGNIIPASKEITDTEVDDDVVFVENENQVIEIDMDDDNNDNRSNDLSTTSDIQEESIMVDDSSEKGEGDITEQVNESVEHRKRMVEVANSDLTEEFNKIAFEETYNKMIEELYTEAENENTIGSISEETLKKMVEEVNKSITFAESKSINMKKANNYNIKPKNSTITKKPNKGIVKPSKISIVKDKINNIRTTCLTAEDIINEASNNVTKEEDYCETDESKFIRIKQELNDEEFHSELAEICLANIKEEKDSDEEGYEGMLNQVMSSDITYSNFLEFGIKEEYIQKPYTNDAKVEKVIYKCHLCGFKGNHSRLKFHMDVEHNKKKMVWKEYIKCSKCDLSFTNVRDYSEHLIQHGYKKKSCPECLSTFQTYTSLAQHIMAKLKLMLVRRQFFTTGEAGEEAQLVIKHQCRRCKKEVNDKEIFIHWESHLEIKPRIEISVEVTEETEPSKIIKPKPECVENGINLEEDEDPEQDDVMKSLDMETMKAVIKGLMQNKKGNRECIVCKRVFDRLNDTKRHLVEHLLRDAYNQKLKYKSLKCQICHAPFDRADEYKHHMRTHGGLHVYQCNLCGKYFSDSSNFAKHKKVHDVARHECIICNKKFLGKSFLEKHMETHANHLDQVQCPECEKTFYSRNNFNKHYRQKHDVNRRHYSCVFCKKRFASLRERWDHLWIQHRERKWQADCPLCPQAYRKFSDLKKHCKEVHDLTASKILMQAISMSSNRLEQKQRLQHAGLSQAAFQHKCHDCDEQFATALLLTAHVITFHNNNQ